MISFVLIRAQRAVSPGGRPVPRAASAAAFAQAGGELGVARLQARGLGGQLEEAGGLAGGKDILRGAQPVEGRGGG